MPANYYEILSIPRNASNPQIREQYLKLAVDVHPDHNPDPQAAEQFAELTTAFKTLSNSYLRAQYDEQIKEKVVGLTFNIDTSVGSSSSSSQSLVLHEKFNFKQALQNAHMTTGEIYQMARADENVAHALIEAGLINAADLSLVFESVAVKLAQTKKLDDFAWVKYSLKYWQVCKIFLLNDAIYKFDKYEVNRLIKKHHENIKTFKKPDKLKQFLEVCVEYFKLIRNPFRSIKHLCAIENWSTFLLENNFKALTRNSSARKYFASQEDWRKYVQDKKKSPVVKHSKEPTRKQTTLERNEKFRQDLRSSYIDSFTYYKAFYNAKTRAILVNDSLICTKLSRDRLNFFLYVLEHYPNINFFSKEDLFRIVLKYKIHIKKIAAVILQNPQPLVQHAINVLTYPENVTKNDFLSSFDALCLNEHYITELAPLAQKVIFFFRPDSLSEDLAYSMYKHFHEETEDAVLKYITEQIIVINLTIDSPLAIVKRKLCLLQIEMQPKKIDGFHLDAYCKAHGAEIIDRIAANPELQQRVTLHRVVSHAAAQGQLRLAQEETVSTHEQPFEKIDFVLGMRALKDSYSNHMAIAANYFYLAAKEGHEDAFRQLIYLPEFLWNAELKIAELYNQANFEFYDRKLAVQWYCKAIVKHNPQAVTILLDLLRLCDAETRQQAFTFLTTVLHNFPANDERNALARQLYALADSPEHSAVALYALNQLTALNLSELNTKANLVLNETAKQQKEYYLIVHPHCTPEDVQNYLSQDQVLAKRLNLALPMFMSAIYSYADEVYVVGFIAQLAKQLLYTRLASRDVTKLILKNEILLANLDQDAVQILCSGYPDVFCENELSIVAAKFLSSADFCFNLAFDVNKNEKMLRPATYLFLSKAAQLGHVKAAVLLRYLTCEALGDASIDHPMVKKLQDVLPTMNESQGLDVDENLLSAQEIPPVRQTMIFYFTQGDEFKINSSLLHFQAILSDKESIDKLFDNLANFTRKDFRNQTPFELALANVEKEVNFEINVSVNLLKGLILNYEKCETKLAPRIGKSIEWCLDHYGNQKLSPKDALSLCKVCIIYSNWELLEKALFKVEPIHRIIVSNNLLEKFPHTSVPSLRLFSNKVSIGVVKMLTQIRFNTINILQDKFMTLFDTIHHLLMNNPKLPRRKVVVDANKVCVNDLVGFKKNIALMLGDNPTALLQKLQKTFETFAYKIRSTQDVNCLQTLHQCVLAQNEFFKAFVDLQLEGACANALSGERLLRTQ